MTDREVGEVLKLCREREGLSQEQLARKINKTQSVVSRLEKGESAADVTTLVQWAEVTHCGELIATLIIGSVPVKRAALIQAFYHQTKSNVEILEMTV